MRRSLSIFTISILLFSCKKDNLTAGEPVEIYLLGSYGYVTGKCQVDAATATLQDEPIAGNSDIERYSQADHQFTISEDVIQHIRALGDGEAFAVTVDKKVIYYGFFKPSYSSSSCDNSITMNADFSADNKITVKLGYPGLIEGTVIEDERNNAILLAALKKQGKLR